MSIDLNEEDYVPFKDFRKDPLAHPLGTPSGKLKYIQKKLQI
jgi:anaerobic selenocysteine-containing dehydrogenase